jgi:NAD(P)-dependent dehydrogenase (short-subunit alcohol dehydrogenase family)
MAGILEGKVALVTGAGSGIGRAIALAFVREGAMVGAGDINVAASDETVRTIQESGGKAFSIKCDVGKAAEVEEMVNKTIEKFGHLDCSVNNAGIPGKKCPIVDYPEEDWSQVLRTNLTGVWLCMKYEIPQMLKQGKGAIVNMSSASGLIGTPEISAYTASKHGVVGVTKTAALEYAKAGIRINAVCPGSVRTALMENMLTQHPELEKYFLDAHPIGRMGTTNEIAEAVLWLCSDSASFVTGSIMTVDGGVTAQ